MTKRDLKTGMRIVTNEGSVYLVLKDCDTEYYGHQDLLFASFETGFLNGSSYNEEMMAEGDIRNPHTIKEVYTSNNSAPCNGSVLNPKSMYLLWKRETPREMTLSAIEAELGYKIKVVN